VQLLGITLYIRVFVHKIGNMEIVNENMINYYYILAVAGIATIKVLVIIIYGYGCSMSSDWLLSDWL